MNRRGFVARLEGATAALVVGLQAPKVVPEMTMYDKYAARVAMGARRTGKSVMALNAEWDVVMAQSMPFITDNHSWFVMAPRARGEWTGLTG